MNKKSPRQGFEASRYSLNLKTVLELPLRRLKEGESAGFDSEAGIATTIGEVLREIGDVAKIDVEDGVFGFEINARGKKISVSGPSFCREILQFILRLMAKSQGLGECSLFWFDSDSVMDDPHECHRFFVVCKDAIIEEGLTFAESSSSGFTSGAFVKAFEPDGNPWRDYANWRDAEIRYWYRRFYRETVTGQLMVLRPDLPELFYFPEGRAGGEPAEHPDEETKAVSLKLTHINEAVTHLAIIGWAVVGLLLAIATVALVVGAFILWKHWA